MSEMQMGAVASHDAVVCLKKRSANGTVSVYLPTRDYSWWKLFRLRGHMARAVNDAIEPGARVYIEALGRHGSWYWKEIAWL